MIFIYLLYYFIFIILQTVCFIKYFTIYFDYSLIERKNKDLNICQTIFFFLMVEFFEWFEHFEKVVNVENGNNFVDFNLL